MKKTNNKRKKYIKKEKKHEKWTMKKKWLKSLRGKRKKKSSWSERYPSRKKRYDKTEENKNKFIKHSKNMRVGKNCKKIIKKKTNKR